MSIIFFAIIIFCYTNLDTTNTLFYGYASDEYCTFLR